MGFRLDIEEFVDREVCYQRWLREYGAHAWMDIVASHLALQSMPNVPRSSHAAAHTR